MSDEGLPIMADRKTVAEYAAATFERGKAAGRAELSEQLGNEWQIVNGWIAAEQIGTFVGDPMLEPVVDLRTLPGWDRLRELVVEDAPALSAGELRRLVETLEQMPAPRGDQPREFLLATRIPRLGVEVVLGEIAWDPKLLEWTIRLTPPKLRPEGTLAYPFRDGQTPPEATLERSGS